MARAVIIGGGVGGLATAIRLQAAGHDVTIFERNDVVGGKLATYVRDGYTFDLGPSLVTWPEVYDDVLRTAGTTLAEQVDLVRLDPQFRYRWPDGSVLTVPDGDDDTVDAFEDFATGDLGDFEDDLAGLIDVTVRLASNAAGTAVGGFTVEPAVAPDVSSTDPSDGATGVSIAVSPTATFMAMIVPSVTPSETSGTVIS